MSADAPQQIDAERDGGGRKPSAEEAPPQLKPEHRQTEPVFETVAASGEQPAKSGEDRAEAQAEPDAPRRKGWWQR